MTTAVISAYSPNFARVAALCVPSHKFLAARIGAEYFELPLPDDGDHNWHKLDLISRYLKSWHRVLWLDADTFVPCSYELPALNGKSYYFPMTKELDSPHYWHFAGLWLNRVESFILLAEMKSQKAELYADSLADQRALNNCIQRDAALREKVGSMLKGLVHFHGCPIWEKHQKLKAENESRLRRSQPA